MSVRVHNIFTYQSQNKSKMSFVKMSTFLHNEKGFLSLQSYFIIEMWKKNEFSNQVVIGLKKQTY